ncbi:WDR70 family WD repeat protein [Schizosaccharomyces cryophilus OY26]|uniref:WDR70 family WD repeat protein n=1 Tax=Schizosaccharomyces cryophilus (strain OY26 / ATCC MYA-4695 / CBS 11777 / NBRC 106824 / NRRL Y48691) TaxID=653667 RepID=S9WY91_SCHCR|nr:WDR70 family WD repeat protein [Schizosaccharomyces cryophilus OY26]EPY49697.1 WDR70 family WD repeat protein [Schizosaccharomyces cryophilus OY26]
MSSLSSSPIAEEPVEAVPFTFGKQTQSHNAAALVERFARPEDCNRLLRTKKSKERESFLGDNGADTSKSDSDSDSDSEGWDSEDETVGSELGIPCSHQVVFPSHSKIVSTTTFDNSGTRFYTGSTDNTICCWDFGGLDASHPRPFHIIDPTDTNADNVGRYPVKKLDCSKKNQILALFNHSRPILYDRNGTYIAQFAKGDQYIRDMYHTKGHISEIEDGSWQPNSAQFFLTCGADNTARIWDVNRTKSQIEVFSHISENVRAGMARTPLNRCAWNPVDTNQFVTAAYDGNLEIWQRGSRTRHPSLKIPQAHTSQVRATSLNYSEDGIYLLGRFEDDVLSLWDIRNTKNPLHQLSNVPTPRAGGNAIFSPNRKHILLGTAATEDINGSLLVLDALTFEQDAILTFNAQNSVRHSITAVSWNEKINQIGIGMSMGDSIILFSASESVRGIKDSASKPPKVKHVDDDLQNTVHINALSGSVGGVNDFGLVEETNDSVTNYYFNARRQRNAARKDPKRSRQPELGRLVEENNTSDVPLAAMKDEDPREALFKYADVAESEPMFTRMYTQTQPKPLYQSFSEDESGQDKTFSKKQKTK